MLKNYFITAWRNITRDKFYTLLNITGLAIGLTATIFIALYIIDELTYDKSHLNYKRIYRLESHFVINGKDDLFAATQIPLAPTLKDEYPEIEEYVRMAPTGTLFLKFGEREFQEDSIYFADSTIFRVFTHPMIKGDPTTALNRPYTMVMTESLARKYFGDDNPVGQTLKSVEGNVYEVTGVIQDLPGNLHLKFDGLLSAATFRELVGTERFNDRSAGSFWNIGIYSYVMLKKGASFDPILKKFPAFYDKYMKSVGDQINSSFTLMAKPLARVHHHSSDLGYDQPAGNIKYVLVFTLVAILILVIACINYMNLATARSAKRSKETGMRKIAGAQRSMLIRQFLTESLVIVVFSTLLALLLSRLLLPVFNEIANKHLSFSVIWTPAVIGGILILASIVGLLSGSYPAFYLSSFDPVNVIKGQNDTRGGNGALRKVLVVFQFTVSVVMITGTFIIGSQFRYMQNTDLGFDKDNLVVMEMRDTTFKKSLEPFKQELLKNPDIRGVAFSSGNPGYGMSIQVMRIEGDSGSLVDRAINNFYADYDYLGLMGMKIVEGRNYDRNMKSDIEKAFVINETAARKFGWVDTTSMAKGNYASALGKRFQNGVDVPGNQVRDGQIIGIVKDFHYASLRNPIEPLVIQLNDQDRFHFFANIRINGKNRQKTIEYIDKIRQDFNDQYPFQYKFLDENLNDFYQAEKRISMLTQTFAVLTIIIAALGLLGLSSFLTQTRTREIGIRKISGASANHIVMMFTREFSVWILVANIIAAPVALYVLNKWLQSFPYKTDIHMWIFVAGLMISLFVALLTVSLRVFQAASINPSDAVRYT
jgi:putative ABC transport system permease protein